MKDFNRLTARDIGEWLELRRRNNHQTVLLLGSRSGGLYRSLPFYSYCQKHVSHILQTRSPIRSFRECYQTLLQLNLGERELYAVLQDALKHVRHLLGEEDRCFAEIVRRGYFREIISTNIDDIAEQVLIDVGLVEERDFEVSIPGKQTLSYERKLSYRLTKVFGDLLSREYTIYNRQAYIAELDGLNQYLRTLLHGDVLAVGIDPHWDRSILPLLGESPTTLWFVNEEEDILHDSEITSILGQDKSSFLLGKEYSYKAFWRSLYPDLCIEPVLKGIITQNQSLSSMEDEYGQQNKNAVRISYIYCDDDYNTMKKFWTHLEVLRSNKLITEWHRNALSPGDHLQLQQERELRNSQLIFIGFSPSFLSSEHYAQALEALKLSEGETVRLVPLLIRPIGNWKQTPFSMIAPLPREGKTLHGLSPKELEKVLSNIADEVHSLVKRLQKADNHR